jgi:GT2 family glycosyltransferase
MISVIVCSKYNALPQRLKESLQQTIHIEYEVLHIDNSGNSYSIFEAYNLGVRKSRYPYLCFVHEDVVFHTKEWGIRLINHLIKPQTGIIGVAGCALISPLPGQWNDMYLSMNIIQSVSKRRKSPRRYYFSNGLSNPPWPAVALDGVFLAMRKDLFEKIQFDESLPGFHGYDLDICLQAHNAGFRNYVVDDILIEHFSRGNFSTEFYQNTFKVFEKWNKHLPVHVKELTTLQAEAEIKRNIGRLMGHTLKVMLRMRIPHERIKEQLKQYSKLYGKSIHQWSLFLLPLRKNIVLYNSWLRKKMLR